jgi:RNA polymerase sigma factor (sigma-70 family)
MEQGVPSNISEPELLRRYVQQGDPEAFRALVEAHRDMVYAVCRRVLGNDADAADSAQNSFVKLAREAARLKAPIAGWLHCIAARGSLDLRRQRTLRATRENEAAQERTQIHDVTPEADASWDEIQGIVDEALLELPDRLRVPLVLRYLEDRRQEDIAAVLGLSQSAVSRRLQSGLEALRKRFRAQGILVPGAALATLFTAHALQSAPAVLSVSLGKMALAGLAAGAHATEATTIGGMSVAKLSAACALVAALVIAGAMAYQARNQRPTIVPPPPGVPLAAVAPLVAESKENAMKQVCGQVSLPDGQPAAGARVRLYYSHGQTGYGSKWLSDGRTDAKGLFRLDWPPVNPPALTPNEPVLRTFLVVEHPDCATAFLPLVREADAPYAVTLEPGRTVRCRVSDVDGKPAAGVELVFMPEMDRDLHILTFLAPTRWHGSGDIERDAGRSASDATGIAVFHGVPLSRASIRDAMADKSLAAVEADAGADDIQVTVPGDIVTMKGRAVCEDTGLPARGMIVTPLRSLPSYTTTDDEGRFTVDIPRGWLDINGPHLRIFDPAKEPAYAVRPVSKEEFEGKDDFVVQMKRGTLIAGRVTDSSTGKPVAGATVIAHAMGDRNAEFNCVTDEEGRYAFRFACEKVEILPGRVASGRVLLKSADPDPALAPKAGMNMFCFGSDVGGESHFFFASSLMLGKPGERLLPEMVRAQLRPMEELSLLAGAVTHDLSVRVVVECALDVTVADPDGKPVKDAIVRVSQESNWGGRSGVRSDARGHARLGGLAAGESASVYATAKDGSSAGAASVAKLQAGKVASVVVQLRQARMGRLVVVDEVGKPLETRANIIVFAPPATDFYWNHAAPMRPGEQAYIVPGLLPDIDYQVLATHPKGESFHWRFAEADATPTLTIALENVKPHVPAALPPKTDEDFRNELAALGDTAWRREDSVENKLTWFALKDGIAIANAEERTVKRITALLDETAFTATAIAFGPDKVWLGTSKGLFAYDRKGQFWTRFAVGGKHVDVAVKDLALAPDGVLTATIAQPGDALRRHEYDTTSGKWVEQ